jgi:hypothetical protein
MTTHTPGPWHVGYYLDGWAVFPDSDPGHAVTRMQNRPGDEANARLIAAAPDMLEALEAILKAHALIVEEAAGEDDEGDIVDEDCTRARAAIAKARGGQP